MYCNNCGRKNPDGANFCSTCGNALQPDDSADTTVSFTVPAEADGEDSLGVALGELEEGKAILVVRHGPEAGTKFFLDKDLVTCGRHPDSDIFLNDVTVSRKHAEIRRNDGNFLLSDAGSLNGTFVNRQRVDEVALSNADEIQIGKFRLIFFTGGTPSS